MSNTAEFRNRKIADLITDIHDQLTEYRAMEVDAGRDAAHGILPSTAYETPIPQAHHNLIARALREVYGKVRTQL